MNQLTKRIDITKLTPAQARVVIAKDVLAALATNKLQAKRHNVYCEIELSTKPAEGTPLRPLLANMKSCTVCALGALFVAKVARFNDYSIRYMDRTDITDNLAGYFDQTQLNLIECAFERSARFLGYSDEGVKAMRFALYEEDDGARLELIMQNIVKNKGEFVP